MDVGIISIGHTKYGILEEDTSQLLQKAIEQSLSNVEKGIDPKDINLLIVSCVDNQFSNQHQTGALALRYLKNLEAEAFRVEAACASGSMAVYIARKMLAAGYAKNALVVGFEKMSRVSTQTATSILIRGGSPEENAHGITQPAAYAFMAQLYMEKYGATDDDYALVSVKNHENAMRNPWAQFHRKVSVEEVKNSRLIASPIRLFHCSPITDGAAALILSKEPKKYTDTPIYIKGIALAHDRLGVFEREDPTLIAASKKAAEKAYEMAGIKPKDVQIAEVHDAFTPAEIMIYEALGFAGKGEGYKLIREGVVSFDGSLPVNVSGGLKAKGHPIGATGIGMIAEIFLQLRGEAAERQVPGVELGLVENHGGTGATSIVTILGR
jgi:acetyl-CoA C-acetyltransferase